MLQGETECLEVKTFEQESIVTFQVAMRCKEGIVVASDKKLTYLTPTGEGEQPEFLLTSKFRASRNQDIICFTAGGPRAVPMAQAIALNPPHYEYETQWQSDLATRVLTVPDTRRDFDEIIIIRKDTVEKFWKLTRNGPSTAYTNPIERYTHAGNPLAARFVVEHLYSDELPIARLESLAILSIAFANKEHPSHVGPEVDLMSLTPDGKITWRHVSENETVALRDSFLHTMRSWREAQ